MWLLWSGQQWQVFQFGYSFTLREVLMLISKGPYPQKEGKGWALASFSPHNQHFYVENT